ncbi:MAG TPA: FGLLP motif-containing membrane protein [Acidimicrobiales bacterium]|nr:FGLLP motif-containing membrane protein [Acidimicrobiales bacterium]
MSIPVPSTPLASVPPAVDIPVPTTGYGAPKIALVAVRRQAVVPGDPCTALEPPPSESPSSEPPPSEPPPSTTVPALLTTVPPTTGPVPPTTGPVPPTTAPAPTVPPASPPATTAPGTPVAVTLAPVIAPPVTAAVAAAPLTPAATTPATSAPVATTPDAPPPTTAPPSAALPPAALGPPPTTALPQGAILVALNPDGQPTGPPGVGLSLLGTGYVGCHSVYFFLDGVRIGTAHPNAAGAVDGSGLSVPGDSGPGTHTVTASCQASGKSTVASTTFTVTPSDSHRSAFVTSLNQPRQVSLTLKSLLTSAVLAMLLLALLAFPSELFNSTLEENYDEVRGWFGLPARVIDATKRRRRDVSFFVLIALGGVVYSLLAPGFGLNATTLALVVGMTVALLVMSLVFSVPSDFILHRRAGEWGTLNILPGSIVVAIVCVVISRLLNFQPGYLYGVLAGLAFRSRVDENTEGRATAGNWVLGMAVCLFAWVARVPVSAAAAKPGASVWLFGLESCLAAIFLIGIESAVVAMLPMHFLDGRKVMGWSGVVWGVLMALGLFGVIQVLLTPGSGYVGHTSSGVRWAVAGLYVAFGLFSVSFWAYFRFRSEPTSTHGADEIAEFEGR